MPKFVERARDVEAILANRGFEGGTRFLLYKLAEDNNALRQHVDDLTQFCGAMMNLMKNHLRGAANLQMALEQINAKHNPNNEASPDQSWVDGEK